MRWTLCCVWAICAVGGATTYPFETATPALSGVRAVGMGDAYTALAEGASGPLHNPAGLGVGEGVSIFGQTTLHRASGVKFDPKGIAYRWRGWGLAWINKLAILPEETRDYTYLSGGRHLGSRLAVGGSAKFWRVHPSGHFQVLGESPTYDLGLLVAPGKGWRVGGRVGTLEPGNGIETVAVGLLRSVSTLSLAVEGEWRRDSADGLRLGLAWQASPHFEARIGWREDRPAVGAGLRIGNALLDVAWTESSQQRFLFLGAEVRLSERPR